MTNNAEDNELSVGEQVPFALYDWLFRRRRSRKTKVFGENDVGPKPDESIEQAIKEGLGL